MILWFVYYFLLCTAVCVFDREDRISRVIYVIGIIISTLETGFAAFRFKYWIWLSLGIVIFVSQIVGGAIDSYFFDKKLYKKVIPIIGVVCIVVFGILSYIKLFTL